MFIKCRNNGIGPLFLLSVCAVLFLSGCTRPKPTTHWTEQGVIFTLQAPAARTVAVAGDFNHWDTEKDFLAGPDERGFWRKTIPLPAGRYEYLFLINGSVWTPDPGAFSSDDGLGGANSVIFVDKP